MSKIYVFRVITGDETLRWVFIKAYKQNKIIPKTYNGNPWLTEKDEEVKFVWKISIGSVLGYRGTLNGRKIRKLVDKTIQNLKTTTQQNRSIISVPKE